MTFSKASAVSRWSDSWRVSFATNFLAATVSVAAVLTACFFSLKAAVDVPTFHVDGAFQTASALSRLHDGHAPGRDFLPYLGVGPLLALYPPYYLAGSNVSASVFASHFATLLSALLVLFTIFHLVSNRNSWRDSLATSSIVFLGAILWFQYFPESIPAWAHWAMSPGNSLRPLRAALPYGAALAFLLIDQRVLQPRLRSVLVGLTAGFCSLWSNDFAIVTAAALMVLYAFRELSIDSYSPVNILVALGSFLASAMTLTTIVTLGHPLALVAYNLDVATDQWWYFPPYSHAQRVFTFPDIVRIFSPANYFPILVLMIVTAHGVRVRSFHSMILGIIGIVLFLGGLVASIGGHIGQYFGGFLLWGVVVSIAMVICTIRNLIMTSVRAQSFMSRAITDVIPAVAIAITMVSFKDLTIDRMTAEQDAGRFYVEELGGYLPTTWAEHIRLVRNNAQVSSGEEYWGIWSALNHKQSPIPVDSVIHALGSVRRHAREKLVEADLIVTTRRTFAPLWQSWSVSQNWWFYRELFESYIPYHFSPATVVWKRRTESAPTSETLPCTAATESISFNAARPGYFEVSIEYALKGEGRHLVLIRNDISEDTGGYVSLNPAGESASFPVAVPLAGPVKLDIRLLPRMSHAELRINRCVMRRLPEVHSDILPILRLDESFYISDVNWIKGVAKNWAGYFVPFQLESHKAGAKIRLKNGETRTITRVNRVGKYLNVFLDGAPLKIEIHGYPPEFEVISKAATDRPIPP